MTTPLLSIRHLKKYYSINKGSFQRKGNIVRAVDDLSFDVQAGETFGLVGESGCGKSTTGRTILRFTEPTSGQALLEGNDLFKLSKSKMRKMRSDMQMVFQDPYSSLDPKFSIIRTLEEPLIAQQKNLSKKERSTRVAELMEMVGLPASRLGQYPHEFSGGQRQRIGIARALAVNPKLIIADEPVSALDVSIQSQILNLLMELQTKLNLTYLFIAHDLSVVRHISDRVGVMYLGKMVELGNADELYIDPLHPYTQALLSAVPVPDPTIKRERIVLTGDLPSPSNPPLGCAFHPRCQHCMPICTTVAPIWREIQKDHFVSCHLYT